MVRVLFVCMGNICRSPIAQGIFEEMVRREGLEGEIFVDSAGVGSWHVGEPPDPRAQEAALRRGVDISGQRARRISPEDCESFDYILTMDEENYRAVSSLCPNRRSEVRPFLDFADTPQTEVPDPYYGGPEIFEYVTGLIEEAAGGLLEEIRQKNPESRVR